MAMCDAAYRFIYVSIGSYGRDNDASIFSQSELYERFERGDLNIPLPGPILNKPTPYYIIGDDIFALKTWLMKPYSGKCTTDQNVFNYRLSRARRTIENAFGIMAARWRIFRRPIRADTTTIDLIVKACVSLHNYLLSTDNPRYTPQGFVDSDNQDGMVTGDWRKIIAEDTAPALRNVSRMATRNYAHTAKVMRDHLRAYVTSEEGEQRCPWQKARVTSCGPRL